MKPTAMSESALDEALDESFPASDPPSYGAAAAVAGCPEREPPPAHAVQPQRRLSVKLDSPADQG